MHLLTLLHLRCLTWFCKTSAFLQILLTINVRKLLHYFHLKTCIKKNVLRRVSNISNISDISSAGLTLIMCLTYEIKRLSLKDQI